MVDIIAQLYENPLIYQKESKNWGEAKHEQDNQEFQSNTHER